MLLEELPVMTDPSILEIQTRPVPRGLPHPDHPHKKWFIFRTSRVPGRWPETISLRLLRVTDGNETPILLFGRPAIYLSFMAWKRFIDATRTTDLRGLSDEQITSVVEEFLARPAKRVGYDCLANLDDTIDGESVGQWLIELGATTDELRQTP